MNRSLIGMMAMALLIAAPLAGQDARRGWLGIAFDPGARADGELVVEQVADDSPAEEAGIRPGDRVVRWNDSVDVTARLAEARLEEGDTVRLRIARSGEAEREVVLVAAPRNQLVERRIGRNGEIIVLRGDGIARRMRLMQDELREEMDSLQSRLRMLFSDSLGPRLRRIEIDVPRMEMLRDSLLFNRDGLGLAIAGGRSVVAGAAVTDVTPGLGSYFGTDSGALVLRVAPETPAARAGLREGDVIVRAGDQEIEDVQDLRRAVRAIGRPLIYVDGIRAEPRTDLPEREILLEIVRQGDRQTITLRS